MPSLVTSLLLARAVTSRMPRVRGLGVLLSLVARAFRRMNPPDVEVSVFGKRMLLDPKDGIGNFLIFTPQWFDVGERRALQALLSAGDYVVDVGANVGAYTLIFAGLVGQSGAVTALEAERRNADRLRHNVALNSLPWVMVQHVGVSDRTEELPLRLNCTGNAGAHSFLRQDGQPQLPSRNVSCRPLAELVDSEREPKLMKLDIEGFEWRVLRQYFQDTPQNRWPQFVLLEDVPQHREGDAVLLLVQRGYRILERFEANVLLRLMRD